MAPPLPTRSLSDADLEARRIVLRRGLARANTAGAVILLIVIGLALAAVWQAAKARRHAVEADRNAAEAAAATRRAGDELRKAQLAQARAARASGVMGRRTESLTALRAAAKGKPSLELRNEAIATLALIDLREVWFQPDKTNPPAAVAFDAPFSRYAISSAPGEIAVLRVSDGAVETQLRGPPRRVAHLCFSPDGQFLAARFVTGRRMAWELASGATVIDLKFDSGVTADAMTFSEDSRLLASLEADGFVHFHERAESGQPWIDLKPVLPAAGARTMALHANGDQVALAIGKDVEIRRREDGRLIASNSFPQGVTKLAWHPDGRSCAVGLVNGFLLQWSVGSTNPYPFSGHTARVTQLQFSHRGEWLVSASLDGTTCLWAPGNRHPLLSSQHGLARGFSHNDRQLMMVRPGGGFGLWEFTGGEFRATILPDSGQTATRTVDFAPDGQWLVATSPRNLAFWNVGEPAWLMPVDNPVTAHFSADGKSVITTSSRGVEVRTFEVMTNGEGVSLGQPRSMFTGAQFRRASITRGAGQWLAVGGKEPVVMDLAALGSHARMAMPPDLEFVAISPDGLWMAGSARAKGQTHLWNVDTGREARELPAQGTLTFSPRGDLLVVGGQREFVAFDTATWQARWQLQRDAVVGAGGVSAFSRDGALLALNPARDHIRLVDPADGVELATLAAPVPRNVTSLAFNHSSDFLAARAEPRDIQVWNLREIRRQLGEMGLEISREPATKGTEGTEVTLGTTEAAAATAPRTQDLGFPRTIWLPLTGAVLALGFSVYTFRYQRRMVAGYNEVERLVAERNRALQQARADLWHSQKMNALGTLAAGIAHDFNNLLSVIRLANDFLSRGVAGKPELIEESAAIEQAVAQGKTVVESMLGYSRSQADEPQAVRVPDVVEETLGLLSQQFLSGTRLTMELNRETPPVVLSRGRLGQILLNLIVNAAEAMNGAGQLTITVRTVAMLPRTGLVLSPPEAPSYVEMTVADSGPGIAADVLPRIFEPFFTTKNVGTTRGTGLGLSMVYSAAQADKLGIAVETVMGKGTAFRIIIPTHKSSPGISQ